MEIIYSGMVGILYATGAYLLLRRSLVKLILGIIFLSNATNLLVFIAGGFSSDRPPFIKDGALVAGIEFSDPLTQALVLTAIIIGFGISALILVLKYKYFDKTGTDDLDELKETDKL